MDPASRYPLEEYKISCEMMRSYALLRFYRMALLLGTIGALVTGIASETVRRVALVVLLLKLTGLVIAALRDALRFYPLKRMAAPVCGSNR